MSKAKNSMLSHSLQLVLWLSAALLCYIAGFQGGAFALVALGAVLEMVFWLTVFRVGQPNH